MVLYSSPHFSAHVTPPGHPERPERAQVLTDVALAFAARGGDVREPRRATTEELARIHTPEHLEVVASTAGQAVMLDPDTFTSPESQDVALLAAGAAIQAAEHAWRQGEAAMALVRPPGHHAEPDKAMGFCLYNNIAVAAASLRASGVARVAIVDFDVHHGNGTQAAFYSDPTVFFASTHQYPYYPGTGSAEETGYGKGRGFTLNEPMAAGGRDADLLRLYEKKILPAVEAFQPGVMLVSAGYDAHELDPLAGMRITTEGFARLVGLLKDAARTICGGRIAFITEGGYHLGALQACLDATVE
jgi:acetoin utilization deacetylase AcuC-like enzyme